jgi:hypothetical protein
MEGIQLSAEGWSALASSIGVVVAIIALIVESKRARFTQSIDVISTLDNRFETPEFRETRKKAATYLINKDEEDDEGKEAVMSVLNFFEVVGYLYINRVISGPTAWHFFSSWLIPYYYTSSSIISDRQKDDPNCLCELTKLYQCVRRIEEKCHPTKDQLHLIGISQMRGGRAVRDLAWAS